MNSDEYLEFARKQCDELLELVAKKNADYTAGAGPFANFDIANDFGVDPLVGLAIRMSDKMQRLKSYCQSGSLQVTSESVEDIFKDFIGYSLIALGMLADKKGDLRNETTLENTGLFTDCNPSNYPSLRLNSQIR